MSRSPASVQIAKIALLTAILLPLSAPPARAEPELSLTWSRAGDLSGCPDLAWATQRIARAIGRAPHDDVGQGVHASVLIEARAAGYTLLLKTELAGARGERTIEGRDCSELSEAAILIIALSLTEADEERAAQPSAPAPAPAPAARPAPPPNRDAEPGARSASLGLSLRPELVLEYGLVDTPMLGPGLALALDFAPFRVELSGTWLVYGQKELEGEDIALQLGSAGVGGCALFAARHVRGGPCLGVELGAVRSDYPEAGGENHTFWGAATLAARLMVSLASRLSLVLQADLVASWGQLRFWQLVVDESGGTQRVPLDESSPIQLRTHLGLEIAL